MAGSQLKRLKASLREQGIIGPQQSKKQRKKTADERAKGDKRLDKRTKLESIREQFNPFDLKHNVRGPKFEVTTNRPATGNAAKGIHGRPSEARTAGEERRRQTLLVEMQRRNKVGGILDRRFGENDPTMAPEDRMMERFAMETQKSHKRAVFDLEEDDADPSFTLTHMGKSISLNGPTLADDFEEDDLDALSDEDDEGRKAYLKRKALTDGELADGELAGEDGQPERKKSKQEVMKELIAKSKMHKYERQAAKEADEDLRMELDQELPNLHELLLMKGKDTKTASTDEKSAAEKEKFDREYDLRVKQLAQDKRAQPSDRTKTEEEKAEEDSARLKELESKRIRRMEGQPESESEAEDEPEEPEEPTNGPIQFTEDDDEDAFGLGKGIKTRPTATELGFDDEDDFLIEDDLIAEGSDLSLIESDESSDDELEEGEGSEEDEDDDEFTKGLLDTSQNTGLSLNLNDSTGDTNQDEDRDGLPYIFPCPQTQEEFAEITKKIPVEKLPTVVQRIRAIHHPKLDSGNKAKLGNFAKALVQHISYLSSQRPLPPFATLEALIRHTHSLAKSYPLEIGETFRSHLEEFGSARPLDPQVCDLVMLTGVGKIFPPSDHFHQVATPATLLIARYLGAKVPRTLSDYAKGVYLSILALEYQQVAKRYVPEVMNFALNTLTALAPTKLKGALDVPLHEPSPETRIRGAQKDIIRKLRCEDCLDSQPASEELKIAILDTTIKVLEAATNTWTGKSSFRETFQPVSAVLEHLASKPCRSELPAALNTQIRRAKALVDSLLSLACAARRTLELHHHRPLAIKSNLPKFEDSFAPDKHYDPDRERAELARLRADHKRERKGALRELRKDAQFMAREKLRVKKVRDEAYEKKYKRLVAEIQGEEGRESNAYEREKQLRKRASKRG
ncbi:nucleolar protein 14 [Xylariales sp. PMI_506]|nr:nucleolar protein 14 [Xylariales sp. PMI_506]